MASKLLTLNAAGDAATITDATVTDIFTSLIDGDKAVTGLYGYAQSGMLVLGGMVAQSYRKGDGLNPFA